MRITLEYFAFLLKERYLKQLDGLFLLPRKYRSVEIKKIFPNELMSYFSKERVKSRTPKIVVFEHSGSNDVIVRFDFYYMGTNIHISFYRDYCRIVRNTKLELMIAKSVDFSNLMDSNDNYDLLATPQEEIFEISLKELKEFGLDIKS